MFGPFRKEKPLQGFMGFGGGAAPKQQNESYDGTSCTETGDLKTDRTSLMGDGTDDPLQDMLEVVLNGDVDFEYNKKITNKSNKNTPHSYRQMPGLQYVPVEGSRCPLLRAPFCVTPYGVSRYLYYDVQSMQLFQIGQY